MNPTDVYYLPAEEVEQLLYWIEPLECQERLQLIKSLDYPTMTKEGRTKFHRDLSKAAFPPILSGEPKALTLEDLARMSNG